MPYGFSYASAVFQCLINNVLCDMMGQFDSILIYSPSTALLLLSSLLPPENSLHVSKESFLGYNIRRGPREPRKSISGTWMAKPSIVKSSRDFWDSLTSLSIHLSSIAAPLMSWLQKGLKKLRWNMAMEKALTHLKEAITMGNGTYSQTSISAKSF